MKTLICYCYFFFCFLSVGISQPLASGCPASANSGLDFDGIDDEIDLGTTLGNFGTGDFTIELWINTTETNQLLLSKRPVCNCSNFWNIIIVGGGALQFESYENISCGNPLIQNSNSSIGITDGNWHHIAIVRQNTNLSFYIDGELDITHAGVNLINLNNTAPFIVGNSICTTPQFEGQMDDLRIWSTARSLIQIRADISRELQGTESNLLAYYDFSEGLPNIDNTSISAILDKTSNNNDGTPVAFAQTGTTSNWVGGAPIYPDGPDIDQDGIPDICDNCPNDPNIALDFDGVDDYVAIPNESDFDFTTQMTVELWFKVDQFDKQFQTLIAKGDAAWRIAREGTTNQLTFATNGLSNFKVVGSTNVNDGQWHHVAAVYDGSMKYLYIDGFLDAAASATGSIDNASSPVFIGENEQIRGRQFDGQIDEVRIWDVAKSQAEIRANIYNELTGDESGLLAYYTFNEGVPDQDNSALAATAIDQSNNGYSGGLTNFAQIGTSSNWVEGAPIDFTVTGPDTDNDGLPDICDDCGLRPNAAISLDGINDYVRSIDPLQNITTGNPEHTIEAWVWLDGYPTARSWLMNLGQFSTGSHHWLINPNGSTQIGAFAGGAQFSTVLPAYEWVHIATTFDGSNYTLYINGESQGTITTSFNLSNTTFNLGFPLGAEQYFKGKIDEVRIWNYARTASEIQNNRYTELFYMKPPDAIADGLIANYRFNEGVPESDNTNLDTGSDILDLDYVAPFYDDDINPARLYNAAQNGNLSNWVKGVKINPVVVPIDYIDPGDECFYFKGCIRATSGFSGVGEEIYLSCDEDLSDAALAERFAPVRFPDAQCGECNTNKTPIFKRGKGGANRSNGLNRLAKTSSGYAICSIEEIEWTDLCAEAYLYSISTDLIIIDSIFPSFTPPIDLSISCQESIHDLAIVGQVTDASDNCGVADISYSDVINTGVINCNTGSTVTRTWRVTDECGNVSTGTQTINVLSTVDCITTDNCITNQCTYTCGETVQLTLEDDLSDTGIQNTFGTCFSNTCNATPLSFSRTRIGSENNPLLSESETYCVLYREELAWTYNGETFILILEVIDDIYPSFTVPLDAAVFCNEINDLSKTGDVIDANDNSGTISLSYSDDIDVSDCSIETLVTRTWTVRDACGNETIKEQLITVFPRGCNSAAVLTLGTFIDDGDYFANDQITSTTQVIPNTKVGLYAGNLVELKPGFHAKKFSNFHAAIVNCNENIPVNDLCESAIELFKDIPYNGNIDNATRGDVASLVVCDGVPTNLYDRTILTTQNEPYLDSEGYFGYYYRYPLGNGVWFKYESTERTILKLSHDNDILWEGGGQCYTGDEDESRFTIYKGSCNSLLLEDCSGFFERGSCSLYDFYRFQIKHPYYLYTEEGETYYIYLDNKYDEFATQFGDYSVTLKEVVRPINDLCADAIDLNMEGLSYTGNAWNASGTGSANSPACNPAPDDFCLPASQEQEGVWFTYQPNSTSVDSIEIEVRDRYVNGYSDYFYTKIYTGSDCNNLSFLDCQCGDGFYDLIPVSSSETYYIFLQINRDFNQTFDYIFDVTEYTSGSVNTSTSAKSFLEQLNIQPNPLSTTTTVSYLLAHASNVSIDIFDLRGNKVKNIIFNSYQEKGNYNLEVDLEEIPEGTYFVQLRTDEEIKTKRLMVVR